MFPNVYARFVTAWFLHGSEHRMGQKQLMKPFSGHGSYSVPDHVAPTFCRLVYLSYIVCANLNSGHMRENDKKRFLHFLPLATDHVIFI